MANRETELAELVDGAYDVVELMKTESPAQIEWRKNWLEKARRLVPQYDSHKIRVKAPSAEMVSSRRPMKVDIFWNGEMYHGFEPEHAKLLIRIMQNRGDSL